MTYLSLLQYIKVEGGKPVGTQQPTPASPDQCKMSVGEFTVSNIHMDEDKREEATKNKNSQLDMEKFKKDLASTLQLADQVGLVWTVAVEVVGIPDHFSSLDAVFYFGEAVFCQPPPDEAAACPCHRVS